MKSECNFDLLSKYQREINDKYERLMFKLRIVVLNIVFALQLGYRKWSPFSTRFAQGAKFIGSLVQPSPRICWCRCALCHCVSCWSVVAVIFTSWCKTLFVNSLCCLLLPVILLTIYPQALWWLKYWQTHHCNFIFANDEWLNYQNNLL